MKNKRYWMMCVAAVIVIVVLTFTPVVIPAGQSDPFFLNMPYSLWLSFFLTLALVGLTFLGSRVLPYEQEDE
ncbi:MAG: hypothetical protein U5R06_13075 [candidate division KSB1 bacterium]|nr:hypothetical protein [candidate division KSB1 bacterium]